MTRKYKPFNTVSEIKDYAYRFGPNTKGQFGRLVSLLTTDASPHDIAGIWKAYSDGDHLEAAMRLARTVLPDCTFEIVEGEQKLFFGGSLTRHVCAVRNKAGKPVGSSMVLEKSKAHALVCAIVQTVFMTEAEAKLFEAGDPSAAASA